MGAGENQREANSAVRTGRRGAIGQYSTVTGVLQCKEVREAATPLSQESRPWPVPTHSSLQS